MTARGALRRCRARLLVPVALLALALSGLAHAQIGRPLAAAAEALGLDDAALAGERVQTDAGVAVELIERGRALGSVRGEATLDGAGVAGLARVVAVAGGFGSELEDAVADFLRTRTPELAGAGPVEIGVDGTFRLRLEVAGEQEPYTVRYGFAPAEVESAALPAGRHAIGPDDASVVIREFSDFQCPACRRFALEFKPALEELIAAHGDVRFEYHHFPLQSIHANAFRAAEAAECAADAALQPDGFWRYHDALFETQQAWSSLSDPDEYFAGLADGVGIDAESVATCLASHTHRDTVAEAYQVGLDLRLRGTPSLYVDGFPIASFMAVDAYLERLAWIDAFDGGGAP